MNISAKLDRTDTSTPWGFRMHGGKDFSAPLSIQRVTPGSLAAKCGLQVGDMILKIGSVPTDQLRHKEAQTQIMQSGNSLELSLQRGGGYRQPAPAPQAAPQHSPQPAWQPKPMGQSYGSQPEDQADSETYNTAAKPFMGQAQYNTPISLYSNNNASDMLNSQTQALSIGGGSGGSGSNSLDRSRNASSSSEASSSHDTHARPTNPSRPRANPTPAQSAVYEEQAGDIPEYKGYTNPAVQSRSFKMLQQQIASGAENVSVAKQPPGSLQGAGGEGDGGKKIYRPSETFQMVQKLDNTGEVDPVAKPAAPSRGPFNPFGYKAHENETLMIAEPKMERLEPEVVGVYTSVGGIQPVISTGVGQEQIVVEKRSTITIPKAKTGQRLSPTPPANINTSTNGSVITSVTSPRPFKPTNVTPRGYQPLNNNTQDAPKPTISLGGGGGSAWRPSVPQGPRTMKLGRVGDARSMPAAGGSERIPMCANCGVTIRGPFVLALDKTWCPDHFNCANPDCGRPLIDIGFVEEAGQLYCETDYEKYMAPRCGKCSNAIMGSRVEAMGQQYHPSCFACAHCNQPIGGKTFHIDQNQFYCDKDWASLFQTKCYGCNYPIEPGDKWVEALNQNWHSECFNCSSCQVNLEGQAFYAKGGKPFCKKHATAGRF